MAVKDLAGEDLADETGMKEGNEFGMNEKTRVGVVPPAFLARLPARQGGNPFPSESQEKTVHPPFKEACFYSTRAESSCGGSAEKMAVSFSSSAPERRSFSAFISSMVTDSSSMEVRACESAGS